YPDHLLVAVFLECDGLRRDLHSFPTRRSSDLRVDGMHGVREHVALDECETLELGEDRVDLPEALRGEVDGGAARLVAVHGDGDRSEEHTSELQSLRHLVCGLLLEKKKQRAVSG